MNAKKYFLLLATLLLAALGLGFSGNPLTANAATSLWCSPGFGIDCNTGPGGARLTKFPPITCSTADGQYSFRMRIVGRADRSKVFVSKVRYQFSPRDARSRDNRVQILMPVQRAMVWEKSGLKRSSGWRSISVKPRQLTLPRKTRMTLVATFDNPRSADSVQCEQLFAL